MRLAIDRVQMRNLVFGGHGLLGNDVTSPFDVAYQHFPQRVQDIAQAKSLLKAAGRQDLSVQLITTDLAQGTILAAQGWRSRSRRPESMSTSGRSRPVTSLGPTT